MGNWRTVNIIGKCEESDLSALRKAVDIAGDWERFHPLCYSGPSLCGLGNWPNNKISVIGNLAERDYDVDSVAACLADLVEVAPSLDLLVHCGDEYEATNCVATITVKEGAVTIGEPQIPELMAIPKEQMMGNFYQQILRPRS